MLKILRKIEKHATFWLGLQFPLQYSELLNFPSGNS